MNVLDLKRIVSKNPKSRLFALYAENLRLAGDYDEQKLEEALRVAEKGLEANPDFLTGKLVRGRILFDKGDFNGAKNDLEAVASKDQFCITAQKLLIETAEKLNEPLQTDIYEKILNSFDLKQENPEVSPAAQAEPAKEKEETVPIAQPSYIPIEEIKPQTPESSELANALDNLLEEEENEEDQTSKLLLQTFENIIATSKPSPVATKPAEPELVAPAPVAEAPDLDSLINEQLSPKVSETEVPDVTTEEMEDLLASKKEADLDALINEQLSPKVSETDMPDLTGDMESLLSSSPTSTEPVEPAPAADAPDLDNLINEQLSPKVAESDIPDLTGDMDDLLTNATPISSDAPDLDSLINEQLSPKVSDTDLPDLTGDMENLLSSSPTTAEFVEPAPAADAPDLDSLINEQLSPKVSESEVPDVTTEEMEDLLASKKEADLDALINEQLSPKVSDTDVPDLTGDMENLLSSAPTSTELVEPAPVAEAPDLDSLINEQLSPKVSETEVPDVTTEEMEDLLASKKEADLDALVNEQLSPKVAESDIPDLTGDMDDLLSNATPIASDTPDLDSLINEQLSPKVSDTDVPDLTSDMESLLSSSPTTAEFVEPAPAADAPDLDSLINEQLSPKVAESDMPDLTGDMDDLLSNATPIASDTPDLDSLINEQLSPKIAETEVPDVTAEEMESLLAEPPAVTEPTLTQKPTLTLAELYMAQGLPQKAIAVYKELLVADPQNEDLKTKLAFAKKQI